jgi:hypothetical protein
VFKKKKPDESSLGIGLHPIEVDSVETPKNLLLKKIIIFSVVLLFAIVIILIVVQKGKNTVTKDTPKPPDTVVTESPQITPSPTVASPTPMVSATPIPSVEPSLDNSFVVYKNGLLGLSMKYPSSWYTEEKTNESLGVLKASLLDGAKFSFSTTVLKDIVPVVILYPSDKFDTELSISIVPKEKLLDRTKGVFKQELKKNMVLGVVEAPKSLSIGTFKAELTTYTFTNLSVNYTATQILLATGINSVLFTSYATKESVVKDRLALVTKIIESFNTGEETKTNDVITNQTKK